MGPPGVQFWGLGLVGMAEVLQNQTSDFRPGPRLVWSSVSNFFSL